MNKQYSCAEKPIYIPKNEEVLSWDPENMERYWQQCHQFDSLPLLEEGESDALSQHALTFFKHD